MKPFVRIEKARYIDSFATLLSTALFNEQPGIETGFIGMATDVLKDMVRAAGCMTAEIEACTEADYVIAASAESEEAFSRAIDAVAAALKADGAADEQATSYATIAQAVQAEPAANLCAISVPGEYALEEVTKALNAGLHCVVFSNNVPLSDERKMKELAVEKGLLCMGPDCGVANINGAALVLSSITARGPFGICGASGTGIQHVAAILHEAGSGVSQTIGTGGNDLKEEVGGLMMLAGIDALEADPETKYVVLIARKTADCILDKLFNRIRGCKKPVVALFMGCAQQAVEQAGAVWAENLDDCAAKCLALIGKQFRPETDEQIATLARQAAAGMNPRQKYVRGAFSGGTYMDEAVNAMAPLIGRIYSNKPAQEAWRLPSSSVSVENTCIDYGEEEFTLGRMHPAIDASIRKPAILKEASDPQAAVILLDFILTPPGHPDPAGYVLPDIRAAQQMAAHRGDQIVFVASVLGTTADFQNIEEQRQKLRNAGVLVMSTNYRAAKLAGEIIRLLKEAEA